MTTPHGAKVAALASLAVLAVAIVALLADFYPAVALGVLMVAFTVNAVLLARSPW